MMDAFQALDNRPFGLALMSTDYPSAPPGPERFNGKGMCLEFQVAIGSNIPELKKGLTIGSELLQVEAG